MAQLNAFESISIDGYFTDASDDMSWAHADGGDQEFVDWIGANASANARLLFGRKTYLQMQAYWPTPMAAQQMPVVAKGMNAARKYVVSKTLQPTWNNAQRLQGDLIESVRSLKADDGPDIVILGSGSVVAQLGEAQLIDKYQFVIIPIALGTGRTVFASRSHLRLVEHRAFPCGNVLLSYEK